MLDPWTYTASAHRMRERNLSRLPLQPEPRVLPMRPAFLMAGVLAIVAAIVVYGGMYACVRWLA